jgi:uncharacterized membrane-anchored protein
MVSARTKATPPSWRILTKVPEISLWFWVIKITSTAMGEAVSDYLDGGAGTIGPALGVLLAFVVFVYALRAQFRAPSYHTRTYWFAVAMVATFGTMFADAFHKELGVPYYATTASFAVILALVFWCWYASEGTLSIHSITTRRREYFYWATVLTTFALGTAAGDWTADSLHFGYLKSAVVFLIIIMIPAFGWWKLRLNSIAAFWFAYIITRPLGASFADWSDAVKPRGLGLGTRSVSVVLALVMISLVTFVGVTGRDRQSPPVEKPTD